MPWVPYTDDKYVFIGIGILWALGFAYWVFRVRKQRYTMNRYIKGLVVAALGMIVCLIVYSGYILARQARESAKGNINGVKFHTGLNSKP